MGYERGSTALRNHEDAPANDGVHGVFEHRWDVDGWAPFTQNIITADGAQVFTPTVTGHRARVTSAAVAAGNHRVGYVRNGTNWPDSEIESIMYPPSAWAPSPVNRPQMGHMHRIQPVPGSPGTWRAWVASYDIAFGTSGFNLATWQWEGTTLIQGSGGGATADIGPGSADRASRVNWVQRIDAFDVAVYGVIPNDAHGLAVGDTVDIANCTQAAFNFTGKVINGVPYGKVQIPDLTVGDVAVTFATADLYPSTTNTRYFPRKVKSRLLGDILGVKLWRFDEPEPDWSDLTRTRFITTPPTSPPLPSGSGLCGLTFGHAHDSSYTEIGDVTFRRL